MDFVIPKKDVLRLVARCVGVADKKSAMPMLSHVLITAKNGTVSFSATDLYLAVSGETQADIAKPGLIAVPAKDLFERVKAMPDGPIRLMSDENHQITIKSIGSARRYTLHGLPGDEFPALPKTSDGSIAFDMPLANLALLMDRTHFSISTDETRAHVNSALFECEPNYARMVSTDGHRLTKMAISSDTKMKAQSMLIPLKGIIELRRLVDEARADKANPNITITQSGANAHFALAGIQFAVKLVDAQFPPYDQVIPKNVDVNVDVPRLAMLDALRAISLAANDRTGGVKLTVTSSALRVTSESPESGNGFDEIPITGSTREITVGMNAKYVIDVLSAIEDTEVKIGLSGELDPITIRPCTAIEGQEFVAVVMPMRI